jgi:hypothetical protein
MGGSPWIRDAALPFGAAQGSRELVDLRVIRSASPHWPAGWTCRRASLTRRRRRNIEASVFGRFFLCPGFSRQPLSYFYAITPMLRPFPRVRHLHRGFTRSIVTASKVADCG